VVLDRAAPRVDGGHALGRDIDGQHLVVRCQKTGVGNADISHAGDCDAHLGFLAELPGF
jgi:hypothetical protein